MDRSLALARFGVGWRIVPVEGLLRYPCTCPDLETFFRKKCFPAYFPPKNASQIGLSIPEEIVPLSCQGQRSQKPASGNERLYKMGSRGLPLVFFPPTFFKESRAPPPESAGNPRCRVHPATVPTEPPTDDRGPPPGRRDPGALRPEASEEPQLPEGYPPPAARGVANVPPRYG